MRLLLAEDEKDLNNIIVKKLRKEGYTVDACYDGEEALDYLLCADYDGIILDIMMPKKDGFAVIKEIRKRSIQTPVLFLTAKDSIADRVMGLDMGANDYLIKPFHFDELLARVRVMIRQKVEVASNLLQVGELTLDLASHVVKRGDRIIELSNKEFQILEYLMCNVEMVITREQLEDRIWGYDYEGGSNLVNVYIRYLRKKIDEGYDTTFIHTIRGTGYTIREPK
ncbi:MAG: response regulator transcription factor [Eubacteriales bacterium]